MEKEFNDKFNLDDIDECYKIPFNVKLDINIEPTKGETEE